MLDHELRILVAAILVNVKPECKLDRTAIGRPGLIERDRVDNSAAARWSNSQFEVSFTDDPLFDYREITAPHRFGKS